MRIRIQHRPRQRGVAAVEFALLVGIFFSFIFGIIELSRALFVYQTLQEVTRRAAAAAAQADFSDPDAMNRIRQFSVLRNTPGELPLGAPVTDAYVRIEYLALLRDSAGSLSMTPIASGALPASPARNRQACTIDPNSAGCIRLVRVRICDPANTTVCNRVRYQLLFPLISFALPLPRATTIATAESLGYQIGQAPN